MNSIEPPLSDLLEAGKKRPADDMAPAATSDEFRNLRREAGALKKAVERDGRWSARRLRYPASEKLKIIWLVEQSHLPVRRTLEKLGIPRATFYRWHSLYQTRGPEALNDHSPRPDQLRIASRTMPANRYWPFSGVEDESLQGPVLRH